jgi:hypothetical protein
VSKHRWARSRSNRSAAPETEKSPGNAIGLGLKYQITGDKQFAELARKACAEHMADTSVPAFARGRQWGARLEQVAISYDLCYDAWPVGFRKEVESYLVYIGNSAFFDQRKLGGSINWMVGSNYAGPIFAGVAFSGLAMWGEQGPEPAKPGEPKAVTTLPAAKDLTVTEGVPVVPLELGKSPRRWLTTEGLTFGMSNDPMVALGEIETVGIKPGDKVQIDHAETTFTPLPETMVGPNGGILLKGGLKTGKTVSLLGYTVVEVPEPMRVKVRAPFSKSGRVQVVLNGVRVGNDQVIDLEKGRYPMLVALRLGAEWGTLEPWFEAATDADVEKSKAQLQDQQAEYAAALKDWEFDRDAWKRLGGADQNFLKLHEMGRRMMYLFCREAATDGGFQTESGHYWEDGIDGPDRYMVGYRNVFGRPVSTFPDIDHYVPRMVFSHLYLSKGKSLWFNISSSIGNNFNRQLSLFPTLPEKFKPAVLWHINRELGGSVDAPDLAKIAKANPVYALLHYPTDLKPVEPGKVMPLTWSAPAYGFYAFRNGWKGDSDILAGFLGRARGSQGWGGPDGGAFRLLGFGEAWGDGGEDREVRRWSENVIVLKNNPELTRFGAFGDITYAQLLPDGSGTVSYDYSKSCYPKPPDGKPNPAPAISAYGAIWHPATEPPPVTAFRAIAVDYSGKSGAPCLVAIVDRVEGGNEKEWLWHTDLKTVTPQPNGFLIRRNAGTFNGVFAAPAKVTIDASPEARKTTKSAGHNAGSEIAMQIAAVKVEGADPKDGRFFFVGTLQQGEPPAIRVQGTGLDAVVTVGGQTVRFDGQKIVLGAK